MGCVVLFLQIKFQLEEGHGFPYIVTNLELMNEADRTLTTLQVNPLQTLNPAIYR
jgi:hypothetical protein